MPFDPGTHVLELDVAVDDVLRVHVLHAGPQLVDDVADLSSGEALGPQLGEHLRAEGTGMLVRWIVKVVVQQLYS